MPLSMDNEPLWITESDVVDLLDISDATEAVRAGLVQEAIGHATNMVKTHVTWGDGNTLHAIGAVLPEASVAGTKTWAHTKSGATPTVVLFDTRTGGLAAIVEAFALGQLRTSAMSGVATDLLAAADARELAIVGTGRQALGQVAAVAAVRPLDTVRVYSRTPEHREAFCEQVAIELDLHVVACGSVGDAVSDAPIITLVTRATQPFLRPDMVSPGTHLNAVGAIVPERIEFEPHLLDRCDVISVDSVAQARQLSRELTMHLGSDDKGWTKVRPLSALLAARAVRPVDADVTLFKSLGIGIADVALGLACLSRTRQEGRGRPIPQPRRAQPRLRAMPPSTTGGQY